MMAICVSCISSSTLLESIEPPSLLRSQGLGPLGFTSPIQTLNLGRCSVKTTPESLPVNCFRWIVTALCSDPSSKPPIQDLSQPETVQDGHPHTLDGDYQENLQLDEMICQLGPETDVHTYASLLRRCILEKSSSQGERVHGIMIRHGCADNIFLNNLLVLMYAKCGSWQHACAMFDNMGYRNVYTWTIMLTACAQTGHGREALQGFGQMQAQGVEPNRITSISVLEACASMAALKEGREIHASVVGNGWESDIVVGSALINMYGKCGSLDDARVVFGEMLLRNVFSWNAMIAACAQNGHGNEALQLFGQMQAENFEPDRITSISVLDACAGILALGEGRKIHARIVGNRWEHYVVVGTALVNMYSKCGSLDDARAVFAEMPQRNVVSWSAMIAACAENGHGKEALQLFTQMQAEGFHPNSVTFIGVLTACSHMGLVADGKQYFTSMSRDYGLSPSFKHYVCMIDLLGRAGQLDKAEQFLKSMPCRPLSSAWLNLLSSCRIHGDVERGIRAANNILDKDEKSASLYVLLANIHAAAGDWDDEENLTTVRIAKSTNKNMSGNSCLDVKNELCIPRPSPYLMGVDVC